MKTQTENKATKQPANKDAAKGAAKQTAKPYAVLLQKALAGDYGQVIQRFYVSALSYHLKQQTAFPRARNASETLLNPQDASAFLEKHAKQSIPPGSKQGQRLFDAMIVEAFPRVR